MVSDLKTRLLAVTATAAEYCQTIENCRDMERDDLVKSLLDSLPRLYLAFSDLAPEQELMSGENEFFSSYIDEDYYDSIRRSLEAVFGEEDTFLETFEEDMKYSDTPIAASISESLADIFQPLYDFISIVRESDGDQAEGAYIECHDNFVQYWSQTLCNVMRPLNRLRYS